MCATPDPVSTLEGTERRQAQASVESLCEGLLDPAVVLNDLEFVRAEALPPAYRELLVHHEHMTTTLHSYHGRPVTLRVMDESKAENAYGRFILLGLEGTDAIVEVGLMRFHLGTASAEVKREVLNHEAPLGDILIRHDVLRRIESKWYVRLGSSHALIAHFGDRAPDVAYGRIGVIHFQGHPAIELLEIVTDRRDSD